jgi:hypothetical protein
MNTEFLDRLAEQLKRGKSAACRRAISRMLTRVKERCERDEFESQSEVERAFRELVDTEPACSKLDT